MNRDDFESDPWAEAQMRQEQEQWEADQAATAEYESWFIQKTIMEADAEQIAMK